MQLWSDYVPTRRQLRQREFLRQVGQRLDAIEDQLDHSRILSDGYADLLEDVIASVTTRRGLDKAHYYVAALVNGLAVVAPEWDRQERMVALLDALRPSHLWILAVVVRELNANPKTSASVVGERRGVSIPLGEEHDFDLIDRDWMDLVRMGMFEGLENHGMVGPAARRTAIEHLGGTAFLNVTITQFGLEFARYVEAEAELGES